MHKLWCKFPQIFDPPPLFGLPPINQWTDLAHHASFPIRGLPYLRVKFHPPRSKNQGAQLPEVLKKKKGKNSEFWVKRRVPLPSPGKFSASGAKFWGWGGVKKC